MNYWESCQNSPARPIWAQERHFLPLIHGTPGQVTLMTLISSDSQALVGGRDQLRYKPRQSSIWPLAVSPPTRGKTNGKGEFLPLIPGAPGQVNTDYTDFSAREDPRPADCAGMRNIRYNPHKH